MSSLPSPEWKEYIHCKPFVKWAGGKSQLLPELLKRIPAIFNRYHEPFVGGGALFFELQPEKAYLSDVNEELINAYLSIRDKLPGVLRHLRKHRYEEKYFYDVRNADRSAGFRRWSGERRAARLIYLNKSCFNGLFRVNSKGHFNVPFGRYTNPTLCDEDNLYACSEALSGSVIGVEDFRTVAKRSRKGDFVYFDPPYEPLTRTSNFTSYSKDGFSSEMQEQLRNTCVNLDRKGVKFMLSNSSAPLILNLYKGFKVEFVKASRAINSAGNKRGKIDEVIVRNYG